MGLEYQHIGHRPEYGEIVLWSVDEAGSIYEDRRRFAHANEEWLEWSHEQQFPEIQSTASGRIEIDRRAGSIFITDPDIALSPRKLRRLVSQLERRYPQTRWFIFGMGPTGECVMSALAERVGV